MAWKTTFCAEQASESPLSITRMRAKQHARNSRPRQTTTVFQLEFQCKHFKLAALHSSESISLLGHFQGKSISALALHPVIPHWTSCLAFNEFSLDTASSLERDKYSWERFRVDFKELELKPIIHGKVIELKHKLETKRKPGVVNTNTSSNPICSSIQCPITPLMLHLLIHIHCSRDHQTLASDYLFPLFPLPSCAVAVLFFLGAPFPRDLAIWILSFRSSSLSSHVSMNGNAFRRSFKVTVRLG